MKELTFRLSGSSSVEMGIFDPDGGNVPDAAGIREMVSQFAVGGDRTVRVLMPRASVRRKETFVTSFSIEQIQDVR